MKCMVFVIALDLLEVNVALKLVRLSSVADYDKRNLSEQK